MTKRMKIEIVSAVCLVLIFIVANIIIKQRNKGIYGDFDGNDEYVRTIDCAPYFDLNPDGFYSISFDIRADKSGKVNVYLYDPEGGRYWMRDQEIEVSTEFQHFEFLTSLELINKNNITSTLVFHGGYGTGVIPHIKKIKVEAATNK